MGECDDSSMDLISHLEYLDCVIFLGFGLYLFMFPVS